MYTLIIHPLRRAYNLSLSEYSVLESIRSGQNLEKYGMWCCYSMEQIAEAIGVSREWILNCYKALEAKGLLVRRRNHAKDTAVRTTDEWNEWHTPAFEKYILYLKTEKVEVVTGDYKGLKNKLVNKVHMMGVTCEQTSQDHVNKVHITCEQTSHNTNKDINRNTNKDITTNVVIKAEPQEFGNSDINLVLKTLKETFGLPDFKESGNWQRIYGKHLVTLVDRIGKEEFRRRVDILAGDAFKVKNCNSIKYLYEQIKSTPIHSKYVNRIGSVFSITK